MMNTLMPKGRRGVQGCGEAVLNQSSLTDTARQHQAVRERPRLGK